MKRARAKGEDALRTRCARILATIRQDAMLRQGSPVETLMGFVLAERGKAADPRLEGLLPVVLYFVDEASREEFMSASTRSPYVIAKEMP